MLKSCVWTLAAIGLWIGGLVIVSPHREITTWESGRPVMRAVMPSPSGVTLGMWMLSGIAAVCACRTAFRRAVVRHN